MIFFQWIYNLEDQVFKYQYLQLSSKMKYFVQKWEMDLSGLKP